MRKHKMLTEAHLRSELQVAMKARDMPTVYVLRGLLTAVSNRKIEKGVRELSEAEILGLVQREAKKCEEAEEFARTAGRSDLLNKSTGERAVLARYLPRQLDDSELTNLLRSWVAEGVSGIGALMARLKERHPGQYDGKRASEIARGLLTAG